MLALWRGNQGRWRSGMPGCVLLARLLLVPLFRLCPALSSLAGGSGRVYPVIPLAARRVFATAPL
jgi:hypothetical protein